jgi:tetratricopeptide (TPR) repeat protein
MPPSSNCSSTAAPLAIACAAVLLAATPASAQVFKDAALQSLFTAERFADLAAVSQRRLASQSDDVQAVLGVAMAALLAGDPPQREAAIRRAETCVQQLPLAAECHYALGSVLGMQAMSQGLMKMAASVGTVKSSLLEALRLAPQWYAARSAVVEFYLLAPGVIGGSTAKAVEAARAAPRPEQVKALEARVALDEGHHDAALALLYAVPPGGDAALADDVLTWTASVGFGLLAKGEAARAKPVFERLLREQPAEAVGAFGLGRVQHELGAAAEAVRWYEQAARGKGAAQFAIDYRLGLAYQALGQTEPARAALTRFVGSGKARGKVLDDAKKRLAQLPPAA